MIVWQAGLAGLLSLELALQFLQAILITIHGNLIFFFSGGGGGRRVGLYLYIIEQFALGRLSGCGFIVYN